MKRLIFFTLAIPLIFQSCSSIYIPSVRSIPLLEEKGEVQAEAGVSTNSVYVNGSYAFTNNIAASVNGNISYRNFTDYYDIFTHKDKEAPSGFFDPPDLRGKFSHRYGEISLGKFNMLPSFPLKLEIFGGTGMGRATDNYYHIIKSDYYSFFGQGNFGIKKRIFEGGLMWRFAYSIFNYNADIAGDTDKFNSFHDNFNVFSFEPMAFARIGNQNLKAVFRFGLNLALSNLKKGNNAGYRGFDDYGKLDYSLLHFSIGLSYRIKTK